MVKEITKMRPKYAPGVARDKVLHIRITESGLAAVRQQAEKHGMTVSDLVRELVRGLALGYIKLR